jgi:hypothetical protein
MDRLTDVVSNWWPEKNRKDIINIMRDVNSRNQREKP